MGEDWLERSVTWVWPPGASTAITIAELREAKGMTLHELAYRIGVGSGSVQSWELGARRPTKRHLQRLALVLGVREETIAIRAAPPQRSLAVKSAASSEGGA
jgi:transcriptional regulator with XRE-family HTH domain